MRIKVQDIANDFKDLVLSLHGDIEYSIECISSVDNPKSNSILFVPDEKSFSKIAELLDVVLVLENKLAEKLTSKIKAKAFLVTKFPLPNCLAKISQRYFEVRLSNYDSGIHPKAVVHDTVEIQSDVKVGPGAVVSQGVKIGRGTWIGANAFIGPNTTIGENVEIFPNVFVADNTIIGNNVVIQPNVTLGSDGFGYATNQKFEHDKIPQLGRVVIEDNVEIGSNSSIDRAAFDETRIKKGTKTDNQIHVAHNVTIGENCLITGKFAVAGSSKIGDRCVFGGRVSINDHIELGSDITIGPLSAATKSFDKPGVYAGYPLLPISDFRRVSTSLAYIPRMRKDISKLLKGRS